MTVFSCLTDSDGVKEKNLSGTIQILQNGEPVYEAITGTVLTAKYTGPEAVRYQWKWDGTNVGENSLTYTPGEAGEYTVTVSASGYKSKASVPVYVTGNSIPELLGDISIQVNGQAVTTAKTGQTLSAVYSGNENVLYQWFKGDANVTAANRNNTAYTPTESGSYTVRVTLNNYLPKTSAPVAVTGTTLITITFNLNGGSGTAPARAIALGAAIGDLPSAPERAGFTFAGWYSAQSGGTEVTADTVFNEAATVYAQWNFIGGTPQIVENTLVHENPLMEAGLSFAGSISTVDGTISYTAGAFQYKFPEGFDISDDYAYFVVRYELLSATGTQSGVILRQYNNGTAYGDVGNVYPWLSNDQSAGIRFPISGAGTSGGFSMAFNGGNGNTIEVRITGITFYKLSKYTVTFDLDGGTGTVPASLTIWEGFTIGAQFPASPTKTDYTFTGWKNELDAVVTASTPIMGSWTLTAQWTLTSTMDPRRIELITTNSTSAPVYVFPIPTGDTLNDYTRIIMKIKSDAAVSGRLRAWGVYTLSSFTFGATPGRPGMGNTVGDKLLTNAGLDSFSHNGAWAQYVLPLNAIEATNQTGVTGQAAIAIGVIPTPGGSGSRTYYIKDIALANGDGTKSVSALRPDDEDLWSGNGASAYVTQGGDAVSRTLLPYEED